MTVQTCIKKLDEILKFMQDVKNGAIVKLYVDPEDIEALQYARNVLMCSDDDLK